MKEILEQKIREAIDVLQRAGKLSAFVLPEIRVERPKDEQFGEYTSNVALMLSKLAGKSPMEIAGAIESQISNLESGEGEKVFEKVEVVNPGHLNFYLSQKTLADGVVEILKKGNNFGTSDLGKGVKVNNEFISANPTGPLHLGNARGGFYGDVLSNVLRKSGYEVTNEYYVNDAGEQLLKLGHSVLGTSKAVYSGEYVEEIREEIQSTYPQEESWKELQKIAELDSEQAKVYEVGREAAKIVLERYIKPIVEKRMHISFDQWVSEKEDVIVGQYVDKALALLKEKDLTFYSEGALWLRTTDFGDDKARVLEKSDKTRTYFASDCGYLLYKKERDFTDLIETWGADHHGYIGRFKAAAKALGIEKEPRFIIVQLVKLVKDGVEVRMSKRAGNVVSVDELIETVGHDVARFFFLMYAPETHMNFDLGLAEERSQKNPVYYVQYAHARLCSILRKAEEEGIVFSQADLSLLTHTKERELIRELLFFPELIETVAQDYSVHKLPQYAMKLADKLHSFYDACRVIDAERGDLTQARLRLIQATRIVLAETLSLMGISAPEKM